MQAVPTSTYSQAPLSPTEHGGGDFSSAGNHPEPLSTLDEPVWETIKRDLSRIGANLVLVVFPFKSWDQQSAALRNWDLWGPMVSFGFRLVETWPSGVCAATAFCGRGALVGGVGT